MISDSSTTLVEKSAGPGVGDPPPDGPPRIRGRKRFDYRSLSPATYFLIVLAPLIVIPMALIAYASFARTPPRAGKLEASFTLDNFAFLWSDAFLESTKNSLIIGVGGTALAMIIGGTLAWLAARTNVPGRQLIQVAGVVPLFISALVGALAWSIIGSPKFGYINLLLEQLNIDLNVNTYSMGGIIFVLGLYNAPYTFLFSYNAFALMNPEVEEAASVHGANGRRVARLITFPLVAPALFSSGILTFILVMENFPVPYVLGSGRIPTLPTDLYLMISASPARPGDASALGVVLVVMVFALVYIQRRILKKRNYTTVTGKGLRPRRINLGHMRWPAFAFAALYLVLAVILPYFALLQSSLRTNSFIPNLGALFDWSALSLDQYVRLGSYEPFKGALLMTIQTGLIAALVGAALSFLIAYFVHRTKLPGRGIVDYITNIPIALPALVIGIGLLWTFLVMPFPIYGTAAALVVAFMARFLPHGYRSMSSTIGQVHPELEESARVSGASRIRVQTFVVLPLMKTGLISTLLLLFIMCVRELSAALFLYTANTRVLSILVFEQWAGGSFPRAAAISIVYSVLLLLITIAGWRYLNDTEAVVTERRRQRKARPHVQQEK